MDFTNGLRLYAKLRNAKFKTSPQKLQELQLSRLVQIAKDTKFGQEHSFSEIKSVADYQKNVPLRKYEDFWRDYWKESFPIIENITWPGIIPYFAVTSGTTSGTTKYIPLTKEMEKSNTKAGLDLLVYHLNNYHESKLLSGKSFFLGGSTELVKQADGVFSGDLSGMVAKNMAWFVKPFYFPPEELALISNWEEKIDTFAKESLKQKLKLISGVPSWMLIFFQKLFDLRPAANNLIQNLFPDLEVLVHGGVNFSPYEKQFRKLISGSKIQFREVYPASEGFIAIADRGSGEGLKLNLDHNIFFEFVPLTELSSPNPTRHWVGNIEPDINYAIVLSSCSGMWSYIIGDTVKFIDTKTPRLLVTGRTSYTLSAFGEHLIEEEIQDAISTASNDINKSVTDFSVAPLYPQTTAELGGHIYIIEFKEGDLSIPEIERFAKVLDRRLSERNEDYEAHRAKGYGLNSPKIKVVPPGSFSGWMKSRGKLGGQNKVPRIINDQELLSSLLGYTKTTKTH